MEPNRNRYLFSQAEERRIVRLIAEFESAGLRVDEMVSLLNQSDGESTRARIWTHQMVYAFMKSRKRRIAYVITTMKVPPKPVGLISPEFERRPEHSRVIHPPMIPSDEVPIKIEMGSLHEPSLWELTGPIGLFILIVGVLTFLFSRGVK